MDCTGKWLAVIFDGVRNSVFTSQVLEPLMYKKNTGMINLLDIVSFENDIQEAKKTLSNKNAEQVSFFWFYRLPFLGRIGLFIQALQFSWFLRNRNYEVIQIRGALAAYIVCTAIKVLSFFGKNFDQTSIVVQARGVAVEETKMLQLHKSTGFLGSFKCSELKKIESFAYNALNWAIDMQVASVSPALIDYLSLNYGISRGTCFVDESDIPEHVPSHIVSKWRKRGRDLLEINSKATVYLYSGSSKVWQCARETMNFIAQILVEDKNAVGVIFSADINDFEALADSLHISKKRLIIKQVAPQELLSWLAVGDFGILLRDKDPVNWVSRPTKALEYQAVGLQIIHNQTVKWLVDYDNSVGASGIAITAQPKQRSLS